MIRQMLQKAALLGAGAAVAVGVSQRPEMTRPLQRGGEAVLGWLNPGPITDLQVAKGKLQTNLELFGESRRKIASQVESIAQKTESREQEALQVEMLLARFKEEFVAGQAAGFPRLVFNRSYSAEQMRQQVQKLLDRRIELQPVENGAATKLKDALAQVDARIAATRQHLENMPIYEALIGAGHVLNESNEALAGLNRCLETNDSFLTSNPVRSTDELVRDSQRTAPSAPNVDEFLKVVPQPQTAPVTPPEGTPTVSELTSELRKFFEERKAQAQ